MSIKSGFNSRINSRAKSWSTNPLQDPFSSEVKELIFLERSCLKEYFLFPLLSVCTLLMLPLSTYWYPYLNKVFRYGRPHKLLDADFKNSMSRTQKVTEIVSKIESRVITHVLIRNHSGDYTLKPVDQSALSFEFMHITYRYCNQESAEAANALSMEEVDKLEVPHAYGFFPVLFNSNLPNSELISTYGDGL